MNSTLSIQKKEFKTFFNLDTFCLAVLFLCGAMSGILPQSLIAIVVIVFSAILAFTGNIYMVFPIMIFYYDQFGTFMGMSVFRYYTFLFAFYTLYSCFKKLKINVFYLIVISIYFLYCTYFALNYNLQRGIFAFFDIICVYLLVSVYLKDTEKLKIFFKIYTLISLVSFFTGVHTETALSTGTMDGTKYVELSRNTATFEDPNYMGFFFTVGIFAMIILELFDKRIRFILTIILYAMLLTSLSMTAIIGNALIWLIYLFFSKKINIKTLVFILLIISLVVGLYSYGLANRDAPVIGALTYRIEEKLENLSSGNTNELTTGRSNLTQIHIDFFNEQSFLKKLFGFNAANTLETDLKGFKVAAHNEYVDLFLNVGIVGAVILLVFMAINYIKALIQYYATHNRSYLFIVITKTIWLYYAATLTMFLDYRFLIVFLI